MRRLENRERGFCPTCQAAVYENPVPATAAVVFNLSKMRLLLVLRGQDPGKGKWCLPGGFQEIDETPEQCALRELQEETGIVGRVEGLIGLEMGPNPLAGEVLVVGYHVRVSGGKLKAGDDAVDAAYFPWQQLARIGFPKPRPHHRAVPRGRCYCGRLLIAACPAVPMSSPATTICGSPVKPAAAAPASSNTAKRTPGRAAAGDGPADPRCHPRERDAVHCQRPARYRHCSAKPTACTSARMTFPSPTPAPCCRLG